MEATLLEPQPRAGHQVLDRPRHEYLARSGQGGDPLADVHRDATDVVAHQLALAGMQSRPDGEPELLDRVAEGAGAPDGARWPIESRQKTVAGGLDLTSAKPGQFAADRGVVAVQEIAPAPITDLNRPLRRAHDVGKQDRRQDAIRLHALAGAGEEFFYLIQ